MYDIREVDHGTPNKVSVLANSLIAGAKEFSSKAKKKQPKTSSGKGSQTPVSSTPSSRSTTPVNITNGSALLQWHDVEFYANASQVRGLNDLSIAGTCETEEKQSDGEKYSSKKNKKGYEVNLTAFFDKRLGISDVKGEAMKLVNYGMSGQTGYLYAQGAKLLTASLMATSAKADRIQMTPSGKWISCEVKMTLKSSSKTDGTTGSSAGGGGGGGGGGKKGPWTVTVYYSGSSGVVSSVSATSTISEKDAEKKAYAKVPGNALWASTDKSKATTTQSKVNTAALQASRARNASKNAGIEYRMQQIGQKNGVKPVEDK